MSKEKGEEEKKRIKKIRNKKKGKNLVSTYNKKKKKKKYANAQCKPCCLRFHLLCNYTLVIEHYNYGNSLYLLLSFLGYAEMFKDDPFVQSLSH